MRSPLNNLLKCLFLCVAGLLVTNVQASVDANGVAEISSTSFTIA